MSFTVSEFEDLILIIEKQPEWRRRLQKALFPDIDIAKALQDLAETAQALRAMVERMDMRLTNVEHDVSVLKSDVSVLKSDVGVLKSDVGVLKKDVDILKKDSRWLKGDSIERKYRDSAAGLFGLFIKNGHDATNEIANALYAAMETGTISENDLTQVLAADLLWGGENRKTKEALFLVMEASWFVEEHDIERAATRSAVLRKIGLKALPVVAGKEWSDLAQQQAERLRIVTTSNGRVDRHSWDLAIQS
jgi:hypothetical protein